jgi:sugar transferase (PEP-CTERM/EpsH1 system associated)
MAIRVLHVVEAFGLGGGVENGIANLVRHMDTDRFEHVLCAVFRLGPDLGRFSSERVRIVSLDRRGGRFSFQAASLARTIRAIAPDVVHSRNWGALESVLAAGWAGVPRVIHSEHGVEETAAEPFRRLVFRRLAYSFANSVFAVSEGLRDSLVRRTGCRKIGVIYNGVDTRKFRPDAAVRARKRRELGLMDSDFAVGCVGRLNPVKDYPTAIRALATTDRRYRLFIVGSGPELAALRQLAESNPATSGRVHLLGTTADVPEFLCAMDGYVLPSLTEGISNSLLEAMASGLPAIATDAGGNPEVVTHGESGLLFPVGSSATLAEHLLAIMQRNDLRAKLSAGALQRVRERFSLTSMVTRYEELYTKEAIRSRAAIAAAATRV